MEDDWTPLRVREGLAGEADYAGPHEGVPAWLVTSLSEWLKWALSLVGNERRVVAYARQMERRLRGWVVVPPELNDPFPVSGVDPAAVIARNVTRQPDMLLDVVDYVLDNPPVEHGDWEARTGPEFFDALDEILREAGSVWSVWGGGGHVWLGRRVSKEATAAAETAMGGTDEAARLLAQAWREVYGRHPMPDAGYANAIRAVEAAAQPVITPKDVKATLSKMANTLKDAPQKWAVEFDAVGNVGVASVEGLFRLLMSGHKGRHGSPDRREVTAPDAEAAVHLAVLLVQWLHSGVIKRVE